MVFDTQVQKIYHARLMSAQILIDTFDFVRNTRTHHGKMALEECMRLKDYLSDSQGKLEYRISGALDKNGKSILRVTIKGTINLHCQRCLGELVHLLDLQTAILLAENENELFRLDETETVDGILAVSDLDVLALIEDEIILSLPISPRHREGECSTQEPTNSNSIGKEHPFATLAKLKKHTKII
jgi:uncharacterized protein